MKKQRFILVDANSIIHRAYHAYPSQLRTSKGEQVNAVYGFASILLKVINDLQPDYLICAFDVAGPTFRHKKYKAYKATRKPTDKELKDQFPFVKDVVKAFSVPILEVKGYEADDVIGTLEDDKRMKAFEKVIVTGDQDMFQLVDHDTSIFLSGRNFRDSKMFGNNEVVEKIGLKPSQIVDYKAIFGDASDNIPGVKGIGKVGALKLLKEYGSIDKIYKNIEKVDTRYRGKLKDQKKQAYLSYELATIIRNVPLNYDVKDCKWGQFDMEEVRELFQKFEFRSLISRIEKVANGETTFRKSQKKSDKAHIIEVGSKNEFAECIEELNMQGKLAIHMNIGQYSICDSTPEHIFLAWKKTVFKIPISLVKQKEKFSKEGLALKKIFESKKVKKIGYNLKQSIHVLKNIGIELKGVYFDVMVAAYLAKAGSGSISFADLSFNYLGEVFDTQLTLDSGALAGGDEAKRLNVIWDLYCLLENEIEKENSSEWDIKKLFQDIEMPCIEVLAEMERNGVLLDQSFLKKFADDLDKKINDIEKEAYKCVGHEFNLASPKQVSGILFDELDLPKPRRTKTGKYSTGVGVLKDLRKVHPVVACILTHRELAKLRSTYTNTLLDAVNEKTKRIHSTFHQTVTTTGRLSSSDPNLQNIPISTKIGKKVRKAFIPGKESSLISFDYSQQELRILAHLSEDNSLIDAFERNLDIHAVTAGKIFSRKIAEVTSRERRIGKTINFGVMYGMSPHGLSDALKISFEKANDFINKYFEEYSNVKNYFDDYLEKVRSDGYARTLFGRRRMASDIDSTNIFAQRAATREIINFPMQGTAADMMKLAMVKVHKFIDQKYSDKVKMILQIHDELVFEVQGKSGMNAFQKNVQKIMEDVYPLKVPLKVDAYSGKNLGEIH